ncbi:hypothetical protein L209DRAFT_747617 [Thermothelomyces heterothallicus CBS 203.75]
MTPKRRSDPALRYTIVPELCKSSSHHGFSTIRSRFPNLHASCRVISYDAGAKDCRLPLRATASPLRLKASTTGRGSRAFVNHRPQAFASGQMATSSHHSADVRHQTTRHAEENTIRRGRGPSEHSSPRHELQELDLPLLNGRAQQPSLGTRARGSSSPGLVCGPIRDKRFPWVHQTRIRVIFSLPLPDWR